MKKGDTGIFWLKLNEIVVELLPSFNISSRYNFFQIEVLQNIKF